MTWLLCAIAAFHELLPRPGEIYEPVVSGLQRAQPPFSYIAVQAEKYMDSADCSEHNVVPRLRPCLDHPNPVRLLPEATRYAVSSYLTHVRSASWWVLVLAILLEAIALATVSFFVLGVLSGHFDRNQLPGWAESALAPLAFILLFVAPWIILTSVWPRRFADFSRGSTILGKLRSFDWRRMARAGSGAISGIPAQSAAPFVSIGGRAPSLGRGLSWFDLRRFVSTLRRVFLLATGAMALVPDFIRRQCHSLRSALDSLHGRSLLVALWRGILYGFFTILRVLFRILTVLLFLGIAIVMFRYELVAVVMAMAAGLLLGSLAWGLAPFLPGEWGRPILTARPDFIWVTAAATIGVSGTFIEAYLWLFSFLGFYAMLGALAVLTFAPLVILAVVWERGKVIREAPDVYRELRGWLKRRRETS